jgi:hypothetical protein
MSIKKVKPEPKVDEEIEKKAKIEQSVDGQGRAERG